MSVTGYEQVASTTRGRAISRATETGVDQSETAYTSLNTIIVYQFTTSAFPTKFSAATAAATTAAAAATVDTSTDYTTAAAATVPATTAATAAVVENRSAAAASTTAANKNYCDESAEGVHTARASCKSACFRCPTATTTTTTDRFATTTGTGQFAKCNKFFT